MTESQHKRWCIKNLPIGRAENTIFWFMRGYHPSKCLRPWEII